MTPKMHAARACPALLAAALVSSTSLASSTASHASRGSGRRSNLGSSARVEPRLSYVSPWRVAIEGLRSDATGNICPSGDVWIDVDGSHAVGRQGADPVAPASSPAVLQRLAETLDAVPLITELTIDGIRIANTDGSRTTILTVMPSKLIGGNGIIAKGRF